MNKWDYGLFMGLSQSSQSSPKLVGLPIPTFQKGYELVPKAAFSLGRFISYILRGLTP